MSEFCKQCSLDNYGEDFGDFKGLTSIADWKEKRAAVVLCEGCGAIQVDPEGNCISPDCHGSTPARE